MGRTKFVKTAIHAHGTLKKSGKIQNDAMQIMPDIQGQGARPSGSASEIFVLWATGGSVSHEARSLTELKNTSRSREAQTRRLLSERRA